MRARLIIGLLGALWVAYGLYCFADPSTLRESAGVAALGATGTVDLRATYGGLAVAVGALLLAGAFRAGMTRQVLVSYAVLCAGIGTARLIAALLEPEWSQYTAFALGFELGSVLLAIVLLVRGGDHVRVG